MAMDAADILFNTVISLLGVVLISVVIMGIQCAITEACGTPYQKNYLKFLSYH